VARSFYEVACHCINNVSWCHYLLAEWS